MGQEALNPPPRVATGPPMLAILSPAKTLDYDTPLPAVTATRPRLMDEAALLAAAAAKLPAKRLAELMRISPALAELNAARFRDFAQAPERPALFAFAGDVYAGLDAASLDEAALPFAQDHVRMLSGLYGLLRPLDAMRPYRLEMGTRWAPPARGGADRLTHWWGDRIAALLADDLSAEGSGTVLNLASQEYWAAVHGRLPASVRVIAVDFREGDRFVSFHAKKARGMMARWLVENRITAADDMRGFDSDGYRFVADDSQADRWLFRR